MGIGANLLDKAVAAVALRIDQPVQKAGAFRVSQFMREIELFLVAKRFAICDEELEVARVGLVHEGIINLVDNPMAQREPEPATGMISRPESFLGAGGPARFNPRRPECRANIFRAHLFVFLLRFPAAIKLSKSY